MRGESFYPCGGLFVLKTITVDLIFDEIFRALGYLIIAGIVLFVWKTARENAREGQFKSVLWNGFLWCGGIALFAAITMGNPTCEYTPDPVHGGCDEYADDGYKPTTEQRTANFAYGMTLLYVPVLFGAFKGRGE